MRYFLALLCLVFISSTHAAKFKIDSYYYHDNAQSYDSANDLVIYKTDTELNCIGGTSNNVFIDRNNQAGTTLPSNYMFIQFWPSYFLRTSAQLDLEVEAQIGTYNATIQACEINLTPSQLAPYRSGGQSLPAASISFSIPELSNDQLSESGTIAKVHYKVFEDPRTPTWEAYVFAELTTPFECRGNSTKNLLVSSVKDLSNWGNYGSPANIYSGFTEYKTRYFFDLVSSQVSHYSIHDYRNGVDVCITSNAQFTPRALGQDPLAAMAEGRQACINNPESCNLFSQSELDGAIDTAFEGGVNLCKTNPDACELFDQQDLDQTYLSGQQACIDDPGSCGLFNQTELDAAFQAGVDSCIDDPQTCDLLSRSDLDAELEKYQENLRNELKGIPGAYRSICRKRPSFSLCEEDDTRPSWQSHLSRLFKYFKQWWN